MEKFKNQSIQEIEIRRRVEDQFDQRNGLLMHLLSYAGTNVMLWAIWLFSSGGFPWPLFVTLFWGIGMAGHALDYWRKYGGGAQKREEQIQEEVRRQMQRMEEREARLRGADPDELDGADVYELDNFEPRGLRLSDDGELVDLASHEDERLQNDRR